MLLKDQVALAIGGGQTPGETIGNGRATAIQFAREGAAVAGKLNCCGTAVADGLAGRLPTTNH